MISKRMGITIANQFEHIFLKKNHQKNDFMFKLFGDEKVLNAHLLKLNIRDTQGTDGYPTRIMGDFNYL